LTLLDPTTWALDPIGLDRPVNRDIQMDLMYDYRRNVPLYREFQAFFRQYQPPTRIVWGKNIFFPPEGAAPYSRDLKNLETHLLDTGHFALETHGEEIASRMEGLLPSPARARMRNGATALWRLLYISSGCIKALNNVAVSRGVAIGPATILVTEHANFRPIY
jgi:hypothetical protein